MKLGVTGKAIYEFVRYAICGLFFLTLASCGGGGGSPGTVLGGSSNGVGSISLIFSSSELKSAGIAGSEVTVTALVKNANNAALQDIPVTFSASSGALAVVDAATDKNGQSKALLSTSGDRTNRRITVTAKAGTTSATGTVDVVGTTVTMVGPSTISSGSTGDYTITVKDSANAVVANVPVSFSSQKGNAITVKTSNGGSATSPLTNSQGQVVISASPTQSGTDTILASSQGVSVSTAVSINASKVTVSIVDGNGNAVTLANTSTSCQRIASRYEIAGAPQNGTVNISTSRGRIYADNGCATEMTSSSVAVSGGDSSPVYLKSDTAGVATVTAAIANGPSAQANIEFVAALTASATISLQTEPAVIGANSGSGQSETATLTAVVRDGTTNNNFVKDAVVEFSVITDQSGGGLSDPSVVRTQSNGTATAVFIAGTATTPKDGVVIQAKIQGTSKTATTSLTVSRKSLFISAGTGNSLGTPTNTTYQQDYTVFVTDASGNPVPNVNITASVIPTRYKKGTYSNTSGSWEQVTVATCDNEDVTRDGVLDSSEDINSNGVLDPGIPLSVTSSGVTDAKGTATISLLYPRDRGNWTEVKMTIRGTVAGTESTYELKPYWLQVLSTDLSNVTVAPPGMPSPYGQEACNSKK